MSDRCRCGSVRRTVIARGPPSGTSRAFEDLDDRASGEPGRRRGRPVSWGRSPRCSPAQSRIARWRAVGERAVVDRRSPLPPGVETCTDTRGQSSRGPVPTQPTRCGGVTCRPGSCASCGSTRHLGGPSPLAAGRAGTSPCSRGWVCRGTRCCWRAPGRPRPRARSSTPSRSAAADAACRPRSPVCPRPGHGGVGQLQPAGGVDVLGHSTGAQVALEAVLGLQGELPGLRW